MTYLARWRLQLAAHLLVTTRQTVIEVAGRVGYESEAAFNRAFKRLTGTTPGRWRQGVSPDPLAAKPQRAASAGA